MSFVIQYDSRSTVNGEPVGTVFVDRIDWHPDAPNVFSYTKNIDLATKWDNLTDAERESARWRWENARVVEVES